MGVSDSERGSPILDGESFAALVPQQSWAWVKLPAVLPGTSAQPRMKTLGLKARVKPLASIRMVGASPLSSNTADSLVLNASSSDVAVADVDIEGGMLSAVSSHDGGFAASVPTSVPQVKITGSRWDLGVAGSVLVNVPSSGNLLKLTSTPFRIESVIPAAGTVVPVGGVFQVLSSVPADPSLLDHVKLFKDVTATKRNHPN